jgi:hypothetical protein
MDEGRWMKADGQRNMNKGRRMKLDGPLKGRRDRVGKADFKAFIIVVWRRALR